MKKTNTTVLSFIFTGLLMISSILLIIYGNILYGVFNLALAIGYLITAISAYKNNSKKEEDV